ncbi:hypothetical protein CKK33_03475 [Mucilaginibacter sp. MD40]|uniref:hypothetical protein n=1 Tax=Mucilaginibacter sp. MD40 TaxID=2029590 RepID=UPI000BACA5BC|nr:hypothetical protein [Mucilaginibacter sp. MD40]PAW92605.1 hypothetical protein CKK33_03475 [Mucilaginibacter sp. MD40]
MKFFSSLFVFSFLFITSVFSQSNFKPGYFLTTQNDTVKGFINYREWDQNPKQVIFKPALNSPSQNITLNNANGFGVNGFEYYTKAIVKVSTSLESLAELPRDVDTTYRVDTAFLKIVVNGSKLIFYTYNTNIKPVYYVGNRSTGEITPLKRYVYLDENGTIKNLDIFRSQLIGLAMLNQPGNQKLQDIIASVKYDEYQLANIVALINGYPKTKKVIINNGATRFFAGAGVGFSTLKFSGDVAPFSNGASARSVTPIVSAGLDFLVNKQTEKLIIRFELTATGKHFSITEIPQENRSNSLDFKYLNLGFIPQLMYNIYSTDKLKVFLNAGLGFNLNTYNKYAYELNFRGDITRMNKFPEFEGFVFTIPIKAGVQINKHVQIYGGYSLPSAITSYSAWDASVATVSGGVNYLFK